MDNLRNKVREMDLQENRQDAMIDYRPRPMFEEDPNSEERTPKVRIPEVIEDETNLGARRKSRPEDMKPQNIPEAVEDETNLGAREKVKAKRYKSTGNTK